MTATDTILGALAAAGYPARPRRGGHVGRCPVHGHGGGDSSPSLTIADRGGTPLLYCFAGCESDAVLSAIGLSWAQGLGGRDAVASRRFAATERMALDEWVPVPDVEAPLLGQLVGMPASLAETTHRWRFLDAAGRLLWGVLRWTVDGEKEIRPVSLWRDKATGSLRWRVACPPAPRPLYGIDRLAARPDAEVLIVEGEKAADAAARIFPALAVVSWHGGARALEQQDWTPLAGRRCVLWPDADSPGIEAMRRLAGILGSPARVLDLSPDLPQGWDLADDPPAGFDPLAMLAPSAFADDFDYRMLLAEVLRFSSRYAGLVAQPGLTVACVRDARQAWLATAKLSPEIWCRTYAVVGVEY